MEAASSSSASGCITLRGCSGLGMIFSTGTSNVDVPSPGEGKLPGINASNPLPRPPLRAIGIILLH
jgi:hypothetical protein